MSETILRRGDVERITGLPRSTIYEKIKKGDFPQPIKISVKSVGWLKSEIDNWLNARISNRGMSEYELDWDALDEAAGCLFEEHKIPIGAEHALVIVSAYLRHSKSSLVSLK